MTTSPTSDRKELFGEGENSLLVKPSGPGLGAVENLARIRHRGIAQVAQGPQRPAGLGHLVPQIRDVRDSLISDPGAKFRSQKLHTYPIFGPSGHHN